MERGQSERELLDFQSSPFMKCTDRATQLQARATLQEQGRMTPRAVVWVQRQGLQLQAQRCRELQGAQRAKP